MVMTILGWYVVVMTTLLSIYAMTKNKDVVGNVFGFAIFFLPILVFTLNALIGGR